jgi:hypothetical protein
MASPEVTLATATMVRPLEEHATEVHGKNGALVRDQVTPEFFEM